MRATRGPGNEGDIALDSLEIGPGSCLDSQESGDGIRSQAEVSPQWTDKFIDARLTDQFMSDVLLKASVAGDSARSLTAGPALIPALQHSILVGGSTPALLTSEVAASKHSLVVRLQHSVLHTGEVATLQ